MVAVCSLLSDIRGVGRAGAAVLRLAGLHRKCGASFNGIRRVQLSVGPTGSSGTRWRLRGRCCVADSEVYETQVRDCLLQVLVSLLMSFARLVAYARAWLVPCALGYQKTARAYQWV